PLKAPEGDPHGLGQFFLLIDPAASGAFFDRLEALAAAVGEDHGARMPGQNKQLQDPVEVPGALWDQMIALSKGPLT
ncbi:MAG: Ldh family oxidoreductase, partial [Planktotalea sp.]